MLLDMLDLAAIRPDCFRAPLPPAGEPPRLFGGLVGAQALVAAGRTVADDRVPHSAHLHFLRPGRLDVSPEIEVETVRDGRAFSLRRVEVLQGGKSILSAVVSFHVPDAGGFEHPGDGAPDVKPPEALPEYTGSGHARFFEVRTDLSGVDPSVRRRASTLWIRARGEFPCDPVTGAAVVVHVSDMGWAFPERGFGGPSLDHVVWFHRPTRADGWYLLDVRPAAAGAGRGLYTGTIHDRSGGRVASLAQESLLDEPGRPQDTSAA